MANEIGSKFSEKLSISVGCIAFASRKELATDHARFFSELKSALSSVENITQLRLENSESDYKAIQPIKDPFDKEERFYSHPNGCSLYYKVFIPFKRQDEIGFRCESETFEVFNYHHYDYVVTYVPGCSRGGACGGGGTSLALIREYLKTKLADGPIKVSIVGPSPFHATFWCSEGEERSELVDVSTIPGIREYKFTHGSGRRDFLSHFINFYGDTLALYYELQNVRKSILDCDAEIDQTVTGLLTETSTLREKWEFRKTARSKIDKIHKKVLEGKSLRRMISARLERASRENLSYRIPELAGHFSDLTTMSLEDTYGNALSIATVHEGRHRSFFENSSILIAGLSGGLLGALVASLLSAS